MRARVPAHLFGCLNQTINNISVQTTCLGCGGRLRPPFGGAVPPRTWQRSKGHRARSEVQHRISLFQRQ